MMAHPLALQLRNLQSLVEIGVDHNTTVVFPARLLSTIQELGAFLFPGTGRRHHPSANTNSTTPAKAPAVPASASSPTVEIAATEAGFNTDDNGAPAART